MRKVQNSKFKIQKSSFIFVMFILHFIFVAVAYAVKETEHVFTWKDWLWPIVNFAILVALIVKFGGKPIREFFKKRTELIEKSLKDAEKAKQLAQKTLSEVKARLENTDKEINEILEAAKRAGKKEKELLIAEGERLKNKILEQAKSDIEFELQKAKEAIKSEAALISLELAEKQIKEKLGKKEHDLLIDEYIKKLANGS